MNHTSVPMLALVVEDDEVQREILSDLLKSEKMDVIECESAEAAELVIAKCGADLKLLITDVKLAGHGDGIELAEFAKQQFPGLNIIIVSGVDGLTLPPNIRFLKKPYHQQDLLKATVSAL
jgi:DNA-binding NtrC family response regulator